MLWMWLIDTSFKIETWLWCRILWYGCNNGLEHRASFLILSILLGDVDQIKTSVYMISVYMLLSYIRISIFVSFYISRHLVLGSYSRKILFLLLLWWVNIDSSNLSHSPLWLFRDIIYLFFSFSEVFKLMCNY